MTDLLHTVSERYAREPGFNNLFTLSHRADAKKTAQRAAFARQSLERGILQTVGRDIKRLSDDWHRRINTAETRWLDSSRRAKRQTELFFAAAERRLKDERRYTDGRLVKMGEELRAEARGLTRKNMRETRAQIRREAEYETRRRG
ncbi:MAG: hypothetical protein LBR85_00525 [Oscillospiraceae bacterium]|nr:hypothetical protein [Oscillospiraceae bacterium]